MLGITFHSNVWWVSIELFAKTTESIQCIRFSLNRYACHIVCYSFINNNNLSGKQLCCYFCLPVHFMNWTVLSLVRTLIFRCSIRMYWNHCHNLNSVLYSHTVGLFKFITHFIIIRCRVQSMITDQTVAINMKVRKRFSLDLTTLFFARSFCVWNREKKTNENVRINENEDGKRNVETKSRPTRKQ